MLAWRAVPIVQPGPGQVRIATELTSVNFADVHTRRGGYDAAPPLPAVPGLDCVGRVVELGEGVEGLHVGQRVSAWSTGGSYAENTVAPATTTYPLADAPPSRPPRR